MEYIYSVIFLFTSILLIYNLENLLAILRNSSYKVKFSFFKILFLISSLFYIPVRVNIQNPIWETLILSVYYISLLLHIQNIKKYKFINIIYVLMLYLSIDSIILSFIKFFISLITDKYKQLFPIAMFISSLVIFFAIKIIKSRKFIINTNVIPKYIYILILLSLFFSGGLIETQLSLSNINVQSNMGRAITVISISLLIIIIASLVSNCISKSYFQNISSVLEKQVDTQIRYYKKIGKLSRDLRNFRHDYKNHLLCIQGLIDNNKYDDVKKYISEITKQNSGSLKEFYSGNTIADSILNDKSEQADKIDIKIDYHGTIYENISPADLCTILSNALDNAIEACEKITDKTQKKIISVNCNYVKNIQFIKISNPVLEDVKISNNFIETSKSDKNIHGIGLYNIKNTVAKHNGQFEISCKDKNFILDIGFKINN